MKHIDQGINPPSIDMIFFTGPYLLKGIKIGAIAGVIALTVRVTTFSEHPMIIRVFF